VAMVYTQAKHGHCTWHLSQNINHRFRKERAVELFLAAAQAFKYSDFKEFYSELENKYPMVVEYF